MKKFSKILSVALLVALVLSLGVTAAFAGDDDAPVVTTPGTPQITINPNDPSTVKDVAIDYVAYRILEASIDTDPTVGLNGTTTAAGVVAYYVTSQARADELGETNLFNITKVDGQDKWFVELKSGSTTADQLVAAFSAESFDLSKFESKTFDKAIGETSAVSGNVDAGYYYITSTLGSKIALQTLSPVTINEKNTYTTDNKEIPEVDKNSQIGQEITYTLTVSVPVTANQPIVLTDTMSKGLTFKEVVSQKVGDDDIEGEVSEVSDAANDATKFTISYTADQVISAAGKTITVLVTVTVNEDAEIDTNIPNTLDLKYGNVYDAVPKTVNTKTTKFDFDKIDGTSHEKLVGAEFEFKLGDKALPLIELEAGKTYRIATDAEINAGKAENAAVKPVTTIVTNGNTVTINGLDLDVTYSLVETKAPTGYNGLADPIEVKASTTNGTTAFVHQDVVNNKGATLPSTGGIGTTIFYVVGGVLVLAAIILLVTKKRMSE